MSNISRNIRSGVIYNTIAKYSNVFFSILISAILARLLTPEEFGTVAVVMVFISFFNLLGNFGISPAIVQNKSLSKKDIESIFLFSIILAALLGIIFFFSSHLIADFYDKPELLNLSRLMSLIIFFSSLRVVPQALNRKKLKFKRIGMIEVVAQLSGGCVAIILAYLGFSYYAIVLNGITSSFLTLIFLYYFEPVKLSFNFNIYSIKKILKFSTYQFLFNFINYFSRNADNLLIGKFFNLSMLGFYDKAYRLMLMPVQNLTHVFTPVLHPVLSEHSNNKEVIYSTYYKIVRFLSLIGIPFSIFLSFSANEIVTIMYGDQWLQSIPVFKLLALTVGIQIVLSSSGSIFQATNRTDLLFISGLVGSTLMVTGIGYGIFIGKSLESIGLGLLIAFILNFLQCYYLLIKKALQLPMLNFLKLFLVPILIGLVLALGLYLINQIEIDNLIVSIGLKMLISSIIFVLSILLFRSEKEFLKIYLKKIFSK